VTHFLREQIGLSALSLIPRPKQPVTHFLREHIGFIGVHTLRRQDNLWRTFWESKSGLLDGSQGQLHGAKNSQENFASLLIFITLFLLRLIPLTLTNSLQSYTMSLAFSEGSTQTAIHASSRGGIGTDIAIAGPRVEHRTIQCNSILYAHMEPIHVTSRGGIACFPVRLHLSVSAAHLHPSNANKRAILLLAFPRNPHSQAISWVAAHTNNRSTYSLFSWRGLPHKPQYAHASSRGGIGTDIGRLPGHEWNTRPSNATAFYTYGDRLWRTPPRQGESA